MSKFLYVSYSEPNLQIYSPNTIGCFYKSVKFNQLYSILYVITNNFYRFSASLGEPNNI